MACIYRTSGTINEQLTLTAGVRWDGVSGIIDNNMISPRINLLYKINPDTALHAGFARYFQTPDFATIPQTSFALFQNTTAAVGPGGLQPFPEKDYYWDAGVLHHFGSHLTVTENAYFRLSQDLIDLGQFGFVPIFEPFNYQHGRIWGSEFSATYNWGEPECPRELHLLGGAGQSGCQRPVQLRAAGTALTSRTTTFSSIIPSSTPPPEESPTIGGATFSAWMASMEVACAQASPIRTNWGRTSKLTWRRKRAGRCLTWVKSRPA